MSGPAWVILPELTPYEEAVARMEARVSEIVAGTAEELVLLVEHPPLLTAGTSARRQDLTDPDRFEIHQTRRGGQYTYHGPGQRVVYPILDLNRRGRDVRAFVAQLETWIILSLREFGLSPQTAEGRVGVWIDRPDLPALPDGTGRQDKIAAIGVRIRRWVAFHGLSINVDPDLSHYDSIVPCGITGHGVTSLVDLGLPVTMADLDNALARTFESVFGEAPAYQP